MSKKVYDKHIKTLLFFIMLHYYAAEQISKYLLEYSFSKSKGYQNHYIVLV